MSNIKKLTEDEIVGKMSALSETKWERKDGKWLEKKYRFSSFPDALRFVNRIGEEAERAVHHPFISIDYKLVTLRLTTWHAGGLTALDFAAAAAYDSIYDSFQTMQ
ncbi:4a-hydroxytetrahydrobiopterin dehydratase [Paenibacillus alkalitolerans]|uniref:4a-hydroxytetrahydrobiopterin dehydratase n=1 Tax=Paenibacillus alkalitolerans TaxID=2799335 RepID=UPI0018F34CBE|nr:4a-hydroxytetrahydrobiopterin dehydratase [Paenibacillus alkalitolerans]